MAYKKHIDADLDVYNALFYRMWYCKSNDKYILGDYKDEDAACQTKRKYNKGYYTNGAGLKFSEDELELISTVYSDEQIEILVYGQKIVVNKNKQTVNNINNYFIKFSERKRNKKNT